MVGLTVADITMGTAKTDGQIAVPIAPGIAITGTWTPTDASSALTVVRTSAAVSDYRLPVVIPHRTTALKGAKITSYKVSYTVADGNTTDDTINFELLSQTIPTDGSAVSAGTIVAGESNSHYDTAHDTVLERLTTGSHTVTVTVPTPAYIADGVQYYLLIDVADNAGTDLDFTLSGVVVNYSVAPL